MRFLFYIPRAFSHVVDGCCHGLLWARDQRRLALHRRTTTHFRELVLRYCDQYPSQWHSWHSLWSQFFLDTGIGADAAQDVLEALAEEQLLRHCKKPHPRGNNDWMNHYRSSMG